jgi:FkbM family methyltransferase
MIEPMEVPVTQLRNQSQFGQSLRQGAIYQRAKTSWIYDLYWRLADGQIIDDRQNEVEFYRNLLEGFQDGDIIFDVGANHGYKSDIFLRLGARVVAVESDETSQEILKQKFLKYRLKKKRLVVVSRAVSDGSSRKTMWIDTPGGAKNTLSRKWTDVLRDDNSRFGYRLSFGQCKEVETVSIEQLIVSYGLPLFVKIDVEGHELNVLRGMKRPVRYLSYEVNLPEFREEGIECAQLLWNLAPDGTFNYTSACGKGLVLNHWASREEITEALDSCTDTSVEIFWKTNARNR